MDKLADVIPLRPKAVTEGRKAERKKRALARGGISRWTYSDPNDDYAIMSDIRDCISELKDKTLIEAMRAAWDKAAAKALFGGEQ